MATRFILEPYFLQWLEKQIPVLSLTQNIHVYRCQHMSFDGWLGDRSKLSGMTFRGSIYLRERLFPWDYADEASMRLLFHELVHVKQNRTSAAGLRYAWNYLKYGYWNHPAEIEARETSETLLHLWTNEKPWLQNQL